MLGPDKHQEISAAGKKDPFSKNHPNGNKWVVRRKDEDEELSVDDSMASLWPVTKCSSIHPPVCKDKDMESPSYAQKTALRSLVHYRPGCQDEDPEHATVRPGAFAVAGINSHLSGRTRLEDLNSTESTAGQSTHDLFYAEAELFRDEGLDERTVRQRILNRTIRAQVVTGEEKDRFSHRIYFLLSFLLVAAAVVTVIAVIFYTQTNTLLLPTTLAPTPLPSAAPRDDSTRRDFLKSIIYPISGNDVYVDEHRRRAFEWIVQNTHENKTARHVLVETYIMMVVYYATGGPTSWIQTHRIGDPFTLRCMWAGVSYQGSRCRSGRVKVIRFTDNNLTGTIPYELGYMDELIVLDLASTEAKPANNKLEGGIPTALGRLTTLERLLLTNTQLSGTIPTELCLLGNLTEVDLSKNKFSGTIPECIGEKALGLKELRLNGNDMTGHIPESINNMSHLEVMQLGQNDFTGRLPTLPHAYALRRLGLIETGFNGTIPPAWGNLMSLEIIELTNSKVSGTLPPEFASLVYLRRLTLQNNVLLSGPLPPFAATTNNLKEISFQNNSFESNLDWFFSIKNNGLETLRLNHNRLTGTIPIDLLPERIRVIQLSHNQFEGTLGADLRRLTNLVDFRLYFNKLTGSIPSSIGSLTNLEELQLNSNAFTGSIPWQLENCTKLQEFTIDNNSLTGTIPQSVANLPDLWLLNVSFNQIEDNFTFTFCQREQPIDTLVSDCLSTVVCPCCSVCCNPSTGSCSQHNKTGNYR